MYLILDTNKDIIQNIYFNEPVKNTVMNDSSFIRILYSNKDFILNGIYIKIDIYKEQKYKEIENINNINIIAFITELEKYILNKYNRKKTHNYKIKK